MISKGQNSALLILANSARKNSLWIDYANYCSNREKGLRKEAFKNLNTFLKNTEDWNFNQKKDFMNFIFPFFETVEDADYGGFPQPLSEKLIKPTLLEWCNHERENNKPFRWYGKYYGDEQYLLKAIELDSSDDLARGTLISRWLYNIYFSIHHLPDGYIGNPNDDIKLGEKVEKQIKLLSSSESKANWLKKLEEDIEIVKNYIDWKESGHPNLEAWGTENSKRVGYRITRVYYYENKTLKDNE